MVTNCPISWYISKTNCQLLSLKTIGLIYLKLLTEHLLTPADDGVEGTGLVEDAGKMICHLWLRWRRRSLSRFSWGGLRHHVRSGERQYFELNMFLSTLSERKCKIKSVLLSSLQTTDCYYWNFGVEFCATHNYPNNHAMQVPLSVYKMIMAFVVSV